MAGAGWRDFVPGEVLTAANVQDYLQDQAVMTFASAAARTSAIASPTDGMVSYLKDTDRLEIYTNSWESYTPGLIPISPTSVAQAGGSASANTLGFVTFNGCTMFIRVRGRQFVFKIESNQLDTTWQLGSPRVDIRNDGRR